MYGLSFAFDIGVVNLEKFIETKTIYHIYFSAIGSIH